MLYKRSQEPYIHVDTILLKKINDCLPISIPDIWIYCDLTGEIE